MLSERAQRGLEIPSLSSTQNKLHHDDPHHIVNNKEGYIKLSSADNVLCSDIIKQKFESINWKKFETDLLFVYPRGGGEVSTQNSMAKFINRYCRKGLPPIPAEELVIVPGVTTGADLLGQILFDSGDVVLMPAPYYYRFANDFGERGLIRIGVVPALSLCGKKTELVVDRFEKAYQEGMKLGKVRAVTLVNPQNPEGGYFSLNEIRPIVEWALSRDLYVVLDEIYDLTIFDECSKHPYQSATELFIGEHARSKLIWMWGLSKNFSLPGLRTAVLYTPNPTVRTACVRFLMHHLPNTTTQFIVREFINDYEWIEKVFLPENLRRLKAARDQVLAQLDILKVSYIKPRAGFFVLMDLSRYLDEPTFEGERRLHQRILKHRVIISAGETMIAPKPGWFRIVFSSVDPDTLDEALVRIVTALKEQEKLNQISLGSAIQEEKKVTVLTNTNKQLDNNGVSLTKQNGVGIANGQLETNPKVVCLPTITAANGH